MTRLHRILIGSVLAGAIPLSAHATGELGGSVGSSRVNQGDFQGNDTSYKFYLGGAYEDMIGGELGYVDFGKFGGNGPDAKAWTGAVTLGLPLFDGFMVPFAKGGGAWEDVGGTNSTAVTSGYKDEKPFYGLGVRLGDTRRMPLGVRIEYERYQFRGQHVDMPSAGLEYRF